MSKDFGNMSPEQHREIARKGGIAAHAQGRAHEFTSDEARIAGRLGGAVTSSDRAHMAAIGRKGGASRAKRKKAGIGAGT